MGLRAIKRQMAKARLAVMGVGNVNRKLKLTKEDGVPNWKKALFGKTGESAHKAQMIAGRKIKAKDEARKVLKNRKVKKVTA